MTGRKSDIVSGNSSGFLFQYVELGLNQALSRNSLRRKVGAGVWKKKYMESHRTLAANDIESGQTKSSVTEVTPRSRVPANLAIICARPRTYSGSCLSRAAAARCTLTPTDERQTPGGRSRKVMNGRWHFSGQPTILTSILTRHAHPLSEAPNPPNEPNPPIRTCISMPQRLQGLW